MHLSVTCCTYSCLQENLLPNVLFYALLVPKILNFWKKLKGSIEEHVMTGIKCNTQNL